MLSEGSVEDKVLELDELSLVLRLWQVRKSVDLAGPLAGLTPAAKGERRQPAPSSLVLEAHRPPRLVLGQADQSVAASFFRLYSWSGLPIHRAWPADSAPSLSSGITMVKSLRR